MEGFRNIGSTAFEEMAASEIRAIARKLSGGGIAADARAIGQAGVTHAQSVAELERDVAALVPRWKGEAADAGFQQVGRFATASYLVDKEIAGTVRQLTGLSSAATETTAKFSELADPGSAARAGGAARSGVGAGVAAELRATYTTPVQADAASMPLGAEVTRIGFGRDAERRGDRSPTVEAPSAGDDTPSVGSGAGEGSGEGDGTTGGGGAPSGTENESVGTGTGPVETNNAEEGNAADRTGPGQGGDTGTGTGGTGTGAGTGTGTPTAADPVGAGTDPLADDPAGTDPVEERGSGLLSPAATVPFTPTSRTVVGGVGTRTPDLTRSASPLGLRQDATALRSATTTAAGTGAPTTGGARPASGPYGMPPAGGAGQRGQGDGRHRVPAYLIDRRNGEELVGDMPLVGPGVIGQWRSDGAPEPARPPAPPVRTEQAPR
ncbi:hypothetical protein AXK60_24495 [Tsukamurella pseudospumae]|uniref:Uncharacterized protein n=2 Tax=Tsukamurella pseudospumae TaxID=239498 RepID=A0A138AN56_9ACTN|nr:hypothetical protein AXK60_24495 [Tsukamurella pseudospumae]